MRRSSLGLLVATALSLGAVSGARADEISSIATAARAVAERCTLDTATGWPERCPADEAAALSSALGRADATTRIAALAALLGADAPALRMVGASSLAHVAASDATLAGPALTTALAGLAKLAPYPRDAAIPALTRASLAGDSLDALLEGLAAVPDPRALARAAEHLLDAPGERGLSAVERLSRHPDAVVVIGALTALTHLEAAAPALTARAGSIARPLLDSPDGAVVFAAARALLAVGDSATVYTRFATRAQAGDLPAGALAALAAACPDPPSEVCRGALALTTAAAQSTALGEPVRGEALWARYELSPDSAALAEAQKLATGTAGPLTEVAARVVSALTGAHGLVDDAAVPPAAEADGAPEADPNADGGPEIAPDPTPDAAAPVLNLSGSWSGSVGGSHRGSIRFTIRGLKVSGASALVDGVSIPLSGSIRGGRLTLNGRKGEDYVQFRARVSSRGIGGSWVGGVKRKVGDGSWSASR